MCSGPWAEAGREGGKEASWKVEDEKHEKDWIFSLIGFVFILCERDHVV